MFLTPEILTLQILNLIFLSFGTIAFILSIKIALKWDLNATTKLQYSLEKQSFLTATIIKYIFTLKIPLFLFFIFTLDKLSNILPGAMCAAGVVNATVYGNYLLVLKVINIYIFGFWLVLHYVDIKQPTLPYTKQKFQFFIVIYFLLLIEIIIEYLMFSSIDISKIVNCCGTLYSSAATSFISKLFLISNQTILFVFYFNFILIIFSYIKKYKQLFSIVNFLFIIVSIISLILFFGTYIYELPTHHCPFCYLQKDYYYVGYLIYILLFLGTFNGLLVGFSTDDILTNNSFKKSIIFNTLFVLLVSAYPIVFFIKNGVWL